MILIRIIIFLIAIPLYSSKITSIQFRRITAIILLYSAALLFNSLFIKESWRALRLYSGLFQIRYIRQRFEMFLYLIGAFILISWKNEISYEAKMSSVVSSHSYLSLQQKSNKKEKIRDQIPRKKEKETIKEYSLIILFTTIGASFLIRSCDLVSMFLSIELQSFAVYILASIYRNSESATSAGLKYFLLGALSSALILLGSSLIYSYTGLTNFESIYRLASILDFNSRNNNLIDYQNSFFITTTNSLQGLNLGLMIIAIGFLFKVAAAPLHNWAPTVYDGVPTIVTTWLTIMPKISLFVFLLCFIISIPMETKDIAQIGIQNRSRLVSPLLDQFVKGIPYFQEISQSNSNLEIEGQKNISVQNLFLLSSVLSLIIGTVLGLAQTRIKRLLAYSTISHVGFLLLSLSIYNKESISAFIFYLIQYSLRNLNLFMILLAFGYIAKKNIIIKKANFLNNLQTNATTKQNNDITFISELKGQFRNNPILSLSLALSLFSMAGIPPLIGFFAKYNVLYAAIENHYYFLSLIAILTSVIRASYYLRIIRVIHFDLSAFSLSLNFPTENLSLKNKKNSRVNENKEKKNLSLLHYSSEKSVAKNWANGIALPSGLSPTLIENQSRAEDKLKKSSNSNLNITRIHSYRIAFLTLIILLYLLNPTLLLNSSNLLALSLFST